MVWHLRLETMAILAALVAAGGAAQAANWQPVVSDKGERVEIDKARIARIGKAKTMAWSRLVLGRDVAIPGSKDSYSMVEALNRYDCERQRFATVKRIYLREGKLVRQEAVDSPSEMTAEAGSVDEKLLNEACKPRTVGDMGKVAEAAGKVANEAKAPEPAKAMHADMHSEAKSPATAAVDALKAPEAEKSAVPAAAGKLRRQPRPVAEPVAVPSESLHWGYEGEAGPEKWGKLRPSFATCASGKRQSPIDIRDGIRVDLEALKFDYKTSLFRIADNGHTIQVDVGPGSTLQVMGREYELKQLHFHRPSEERINGRSYDMAMHLVHKDYDGHLAVLAVLLEKGSENPLIQTLWNSLPLEVGQDLEPNVALNLAGLLPEQRNYFAYMGSLTTPPCTEDVLWLVLKQPLQISPEQIAIFSRLYHHNARPVQPSNNRLIKESR